MTRETIIAEARKLIGVPFLHQGRDPRRGLDCSGVLIVTAMAAGLQPRNEKTLMVTNYRREADPELLLTAVRNEADPVSIADILPADILLFCWPGRTPPQHFAWVSGIEPTYIIETQRTTNSVTEHILGAHERACIHSAWRLKDFLDG